MLVLTRRVGENLIIGDSITINILSVRGAGTRIGVEAPLETKVHRLEVHERIEKEKNLEASASIAGAKKINSSKSFAPNLDYKPKD